MKNLFEHPWSQDESKRNSKSILISKILTYKYQFKIYYVENSFQNLGTKIKKYLHTLYEMKNFFEHSWSQDESKRNSNRFEFQKSD